MPSKAVAPQKAKSIPLTLLSEKDFDRWATSQKASLREWLKVQNFSAASGSFCVLPDDEGRMGSLIAGLSETPSLWDIAGLPLKVPFATYHLDWQGPIAFQEWLTLGWELGSYQFTRYKAAEKKPAILIHAKGANSKKIERYARAINRARDLINTPAEDLGPEALATAIINVGKSFGAKVRQIKGDALLKENFPAIHVVGRASSRPPILVDLRWGNPKNPAVTLVGKGVCFDTGGLDIKSSAGMYLMKKDMGGAACALAVAEMVMDAALPVYLRLLVPCVENSISGNAYRPSDIIKMRNGLTVEVGNTDAEGRLVLADALSEALTDRPKMIIDFATLTGAARTALGTDLPGLFCNDDALASVLCAAAKDMEDPIWRMPLFKAYDKMLESSLADLNSAPNSPYAGAITAALFLQHFVSEKQAWAHFDLMAWNTQTKAGRPEGGEAMAVRAVFRAIESGIDAF